MNEKLIKAIIKNKEWYKEMKERNEFAWNKAIDDYTKEVKKEWKKEIIKVCKEMKGKKIKEYEEDYYGDRGYDGYWRAIDETIKLLKKGVYYENKT